MKKLITLMNCIIIVITCNGQGFNLENQLLNCLFKTSSDAGIDIKKEFYMFENSLIQNKILNDSSGESYFNLLKHIEKSGGSDYLVSYNLQDTIIKHYGYVDLTKFLSELSVCCEKILKNESIEISGLYDLDSLIQNKNINVLLISNAISGVLNPKHFEYLYYKMAFMFTLTILYYSEIKIKLPDSHNVKNE